MIFSEAWLQQAINQALIGFLLVTAVTLVFARGLLVSTVLLMIFSLLMAVIYLALDAPDVAITEAAVGAGISTVLLLAALIHTGTEEAAPSRRGGVALAPLLSVGAVGAALLYAVADMPYAGASDAPSQVYLAPEFLSRTTQDMGFPNVVTAILASYRGWDTLGEVVVVFTALLCVLLLLERPGRNTEREANDDVAASSGNGKEE